MSERPGVMERGIGSPSVSKACGCEKEEYGMTLGRRGKPCADKVRIWGHQGYGKVMCQ